MTFNIWNIKMLLTRLSIENLTSNCMRLSYHGITSNGLRNGACGFDGIALPFRSNKIAGRLR